VVEDKIGVAMLFIVAVGVHRGNYGVVEVDTEFLLLDMVDGHHHHHEVEASGAMVVIQNYLGMKFQHQLSLAKKMWGEYQDLGLDLGELNGIPGDHQGEDNTALLFSNILHLCLYTLHPLSLYSYLDCEYGMAF
jgi:hypothetical protein